MEKMDIEQVLEHLEKAAALIMLASEFNQWNLELLETAPHLWILVERLRWRVNQDVEEAALIRRAARLKSVKRNMGQRNDGTNDASPHGGDDNGR